MRTDRWKMVLAASLVAIAICMAGYFTHASVSIQTGCKTVEGTRLCGDSLRAYEDFVKAMQASFGS